MGGENIDAREKLKLKNNKIRDFSHIKKTTWKVRNLENLRKGGEEVGHTEKHVKNEKRRMLPIWHLEKERAKEREKVTKTY